MTDDERMKLWADFLEHMQRVHENRHPFLGDGEVEIVAKLEASNKRAAYRLRAKQAWHEEFTYPADSWPGRRQETDDFCNAIRRDPAFVAAGKKSP